MRRPSDPRRGGFLIFSNKLIRFYEKKPELITGDGNRFCFSTNNKSSKLRTVGPSHAALFGERDCAVIEQLHKNGYLSLSWDCPVKDLGIGFWKPDFYKRMIFGYPEPDNTF